MPLFKVECTSGFCGVDEIVIVDATDESEAEEIAQEWWSDQVAPSTGGAEETSESDAEGYERIN